MYTTHTRVGDTNIYIYIYINPWESDHRDDPTGHKKLTFRFCKVRVDFTNYQERRFLNVGSSLKNYNWKGRPR